MVINPVTLIAGVKTIAIGIEHPFDDGNTGFRIVSTNVADDVDDTVISIKKSDATMIYS